MNDYKKILEGVVNIINTTEKSDIGFANICTYIGENCPELKESEDERIRKEIIKYLEQTVPHHHRDEVLKSKEWIAWLEKQGEHSIYNVPSREVILAIWDLGNEWKELTNGSISTEYGTQLDYIQKHWHESEYYLKEKQGEQNLDWSEEDETRLQACLDTLQANSLMGKVDTVMTNWLKSLKNRIKGE